MSAGHQEPTEPRPPTKEEQDILDKVKEQFVEQSKTKPSEFKGILVSTLIANSTVYLFKVYTGDGTYSHLKVFVTHVLKEPILQGFQLNKTLEDKLVLF